MTRLEMLSRQKSLQKRELCEHGEHGEDSPWYNCLACRKASTLTMKPDTSWRAGLGGEK